MAGKADVMSASSPSTESLLAIRFLPSPSVRLDHRDDGSYIQLVSFDPETGEPRFAFIPLPEVTSRSPEIALAKSRKRAKSERRFSQLLSLDPQLCGWCESTSALVSPDRPFCRNCEEVRAGF